ncbi:methylmalonyl-CoA mutase [Modestobacter sp. I12A-02628]|uniref:Fused isobutyryl-CoA mutase n=1 Tax=Goekera deserti TaxID=2497753 RepID=A0A7K3W9J2_9ACTN|nr:fused isobutyryl-CoA mutase/GTPase IcmF [Goekera deserti]MPQ98822.1 methylmalonyl-CoA mutase [Goekera deserti]NDI49679.1 methylmalonyl-CoA mutase [Goekera deserti]NEL53128.1 methylmalonyl-CoA mutase [Goekera deserti]
MPELHIPRHPVRFVTAASLFDGHDAAINVMRRLLQAQGAEVVHLGHDRSVQSVVRAALEEDAQGIALSSYQGGHVEYFSYLVEELDRHGAGHVQVFGGGGGVIVPEEIALLRSRGVRIFSPEDGQALGLPGMINTLVQACDVDLAAAGPDVDALLAGDPAALARAITVLEAGRSPELAARVVTEAARRHVPVLGITGTGGSGKSSLTDELLRRLRLDQEDELRIAVLAVDPSRRRGGGALLGDRIRMNALETGDRASTFFRSLATRTAGAQVPEHLDHAIAAVKAAGYDLVIVETPGIGQGDAAILPYSDVSLYVMTPEFGAASQLEKIDMLDFADVVAVNKFERRGAEDARRDVARQMVRNREAFGTPWEQMPVFGTSAARFDDDGVTALFQELKTLLAGKGLALGSGVLPRVEVRASSGLTSVVPSSRARYLAEVAEAVRGYHRTTAEQAELLRRRQHLTTAAQLLDGDAAEAAAARAREIGGELLPAVSALLDEWPATVAEYSGDELVYTVRGKEIHTPLTRRTLSGNPVRRVSLPRTTDHGELVGWLRGENVPGRFPYTAGVFPFKRQGEAPARMFAGEGDAFRTNQRFRLLSEGQPATRLSTAFDSVTLYGRDPDPRPDVYGKVGTSGVSIATLDDMKALYAGFDLVAPTTSVSMTINGPAPAVLAMFLNTAIDQQLAGSTEDPDAVRARVLATVRGTVQADILKEDQGQNTCIFSTEFALRCMADVQEWFIDHGVRNFYSVSISGYHIAEAGANPISQLAFTLANGFTYVEAYLARGMAIDDFAPNLSFFFSNGMDAEYTVIGRVARRIWAVAMKERYGASARSQQLKYHVQTSGRSLHAQEMDFNDIRTSLQALCAIYDNANSLHTNAYDEAVTTPSAHSVRRALAIQMIIDREWGLAMNENPLQGSFVVDELTDLVEEAVLAEFDRIAERGGVLGAMETGYQRGRIQDESMLYEHRKHDGSLPIVGVNTFLAPDAGDEEPGTVELARATEAEKQSQLRRLADFHARHAADAPAALARLQQAAVGGGNVFEALMDAVRYCSLGQISDAFFEVGGQYRRNV